MGVLSPDELAGLVADGDVRVVFAVAPGNFGHPLGRAYPAEVFLRRFVEGSGSGFPGAYLAFDIAEEPVRALDHAGGFSRGIPDVWSVADLTTLRMCPWVPGAAICILDLCAKPDSSRLCDWAPRTILKRQVAALAESGYAIECASEIEFLVLSPSSGGAVEDSGPVSATRSHGAYRLDPLFEAWQFIDEVVEATGALGIAVESFGAEAAPGQFEVNLSHCGPVEMADQHMLYKFGVREIARRHGMVATFMARPTESYGNSCHFHASLWEVADSTSATDQAFAAFVAGQLELAAPLLPMVAPVPNSYRRFAPHLGTPISIVAGHENRTAAIRVIHDVTGSRAENRLPGADVNPYFGLAAIVAQARFGIDNALNPPELVDEYIRGDAGHPVVPEDLSAALTALEESSSARDLLGDIAFNHVLAISAHEHQQAEKHNPDAELGWELERYLERI